MASGKAASIKKSHRGRKRRMLGWTFLTLGLLVAGVWAWSRHWMLYFGVGTRQCILMNGELAISSASPSFRSKLSLDRAGLHKWELWYGWREPLRGSDSARRGLVRLERSRGEWIGTWFVVWPAPLLLGLASVGLLRSGILARRRALTGNCKTCGYDLAGLGDDAKCPECGKAKS